MGPVASVCAFDRLSRHSPLLKLGENGKSIASSTKGDGVVFCPMTNIVCINGFGPIYSTLGNLKTHHIPPLVQNI